MIYRLWHGWTTPRNADADDRSSTVMYPLGLTPKFSCKGT